MFYLSCTFPSCSRKDLLCFRLEYAVTVKNTLCLYLLLLQITDYSLILQFSHQLSDDLYKEYKLLGFSPLLWNFGFWKQIPSFYAFPVCFHVIIIYVFSTTLINSIFLEVNKTPKLVQRKQIFTCKCQQHPTSSQQK